MEPHRQAQQQAAWQSLAQSRGWRAWALWPLSLLYGALVALHHRLYRWGLLSPRRLPVPVVVVGNVVVGGAGKTPTVLALVQHLRQRGWRPGVISRGYGREGEAPTPVHPDTPAAQVGDEPLQIRRQTGVPVCVARSRVDAGHALLAAHPEVNLIVCDDGLQHLALHADLRIAVFDDRGLGNGWLLPAGLLREPWPPSGARPLPQVLLRQSRAGQAAANIPVPKGARCFDAQRSLGANAVNQNGTTRSLDSFTDAPVSALAGVARPEVFFGMLSDRGLRLQASVALPDHAEAAAVIATSQQLPAPVLCTEKDLVKLGGAAGQTSVWAVPLQVTIDPAFFEAVDTHLPLPPVPRG